MPGAFSVPATDAYRYGTTAIKRCSTLHRRPRSCRANVESYLAAKAERVRQVEETLKRSTDLNQRQLALLAHALRHPNAEYTIRSHMTSHSVAYATARADLFRLAELGLLERRRVGRRSYLFFPPTDLDDRARGAD